MFTVLEQHVQIKNRGCTRTFCKTADCKKLYHVRQLHGGCQHLWQYGKGIIIHHPKPVWRAQCCLWTGSGLCYNNKWEWGYEIHYTSWKISFRCVKSHHTGSVTTQLQCKTGIVMHLLLPLATLPHRGGCNDWITGMWAQSYDPKWLEPPRPITEETLLIKVTPSVTHEAHSIILPWSTWRQNCQCPLYSNNHNVWRCVCLCGHQYQWPCDKVTVHWSYSYLWFWPLPRQKGTSLRKAVLPG